MFQYAGNSSRFPVNVGLVDDADLNPATAAALDVAGQNLADRTSYLFANVAPLVALNWQSEQRAADIATATGVTATNPVIAAVCWDALSGVWRAVLTGRISGTPSIWTAKNSGLDTAWVQVTPPFQPPSATFSVAGAGLSVVADGGDAGTFYFATTDTFDGEALVYKCIGTGAPTLVLDALVSGASDVSLGWFGPRLLVGITTSSGSGCLLESSANQGSTWSVTPFSANAFAKVFFSTSAFAGVSRVHAVASGVAARSTDGVTWTTASAPGGIQGVGHGFDELGEALYAPSSTVPALYRSADGVTWSARDSASAFAQVTGLAAVGGTLVAPLASSRYGGSGANAAVLSLDGGSHWRYSQAQIATAGGATHVEVSPIQFLLWRDTALRFSLLSGFPPVAF